MEPGSRQNLRPGYPSSVECPSEKSLDKAPYNSGRKAEVRIRKSSAGCVLIVGAHCAFLRLDQLSAQCAQKSQSDGDPDHIAISGNESFIKGAL